jgi:opacity protein-like surface antigen
MRHLLWWLVVLSVAVTAVPAFGQGMTKDIFLSGGVGSWKPDDSEERGLLFFGGARFSLGDRFALEGTVGRWGVSEDVIEGGTTVGEAKASTVPISLSGLLVVPVSHATPLYFYGGGGIDYHLWKIETELKEGYEFPDGSTSETEDKTSLGFHFRGGLEYAVAPHVRLGGEVKYFIGKVDDWDFSYNGVCFSGVLKYMFPMN